MLQRTSFQRFSTTPDLREQKRLMSLRYPSQRLSRCLCPMVVGLKFNYSVLPVGGRNCAMLPILSSLKCKFQISKNIRQNLSIYTSCSFLSNIQRKQKQKKFLLYCILICCLFLFFFCTYL